MIRFVLFVSSKHHLRMRLVFSVSLCSNQMLLLSRRGHLIGAAERSSTFTPESANRADRRYQYIYTVLYQLYVSRYVPYGQQAMAVRLSLCCAYLFGAS